MSKVYNFFLDIDGTMLPAGKRELSDELRSALLFAKSKGCKIFINTGRTKAFVPYALRKDECFDGLCCGCGTYVEYGGKVLLESYLKREDLDDMCRVFYECDDGGDLLFEGLERMFYIGRTAQWFIDLGMIKADSENYFTECRFEPKVQKFSAHMSEESCDRMIKILSDKYNCMVFPHYTEIVPLGYDKGRAIQLTEEVLGLDPALSVAVGDSMNDAEMLRYASTSIAMGNAPAEVKEMCDIVADDIKNEGLAKIIRELLT